MATDRKTREIKRLRRRLEISEEDRKRMESLAIARNNEALGLHRKMDEQGWRHRIALWTERRATAEAEIALAMKGLDLHRACYPDTMHLPSQTCEEWASQRKAARDAAQNLPKD